MLVYLCGAMSVLSTEEAAKWRTQFIDYYKTVYESDKLQFFNPVDYFNYDMNPDQYSDKEVFMYEKRMVEKADIVVVNLDRIKESVGSCQELAFAYSKGIPIIGFHSNQLYSEVIERTHPWILEELDKIFTGEEAIIEMADYIHYYYEDFA